MLKIRARYMRSLLQKQGNLWENSIDPGGNVKIYLKSHNFETARNVNTKF